MFQCANMITLRHREQTRMSGFSKRKLKALLGRPELKQAGIAREIGVNQHTIKRYIDGKVTPSVDTLYKISVLFEKPMDYFFE